MFFANQINSKGGLKVALICLITEAVGLFLLFLAPTASLALIGAAITLFTGKSVWFSGMRQVVFGLAAQILVQQQVAIVRTVSKVVNGHDSP